MGYIVRSITLIITSFLSFRRPLSLSPPFLAPSRGREWRKGGRRGGGWESCSSHTAIPYLSVSVSVAHFVANVADEDRTR